MPIDEAVMLIVPTVRADMSKVSGECQGLLIIAVSWVYANELSDFFSIRTVNPNNDINMKRPPVMPLGINPCCTEHLRVQTAV